MIAVVAGAIGGAGAATATPNGSETGSSTLAPFDQVGHTHDLGAVSADGMSVHNKTGRVFIVSCQSSCVRVWDPKTGADTTITLPLGGLWQPGSFSLVVDQDRDKVYLGGQGYALGVIDANTLQATAVALLEPGTTWPPQWVRSITVDQASGRVFGFYDGDPGAVFEIDPATGQSTRIVALPYSSALFDGAYDAKTGRFWIADANTYRVLVADPASGRTDVLPQELHAWPNGVVIDQTARRVYVSNRGGVTVYDADTEAKLATFATRAWRKDVVGRIAIDPSGEHLYLEGETNNSVVTVNARTGAVEAEYLVPGAAPVDRLAVNGVTGELFVSQDGAIGSRYPSALNQFGAAPKITSGDPVAGVVGQPMAHAFHITGAPLADLTVTGDLPPGVTFNRDRLALEGTPTAAGEFRVTATATNGIDPAATRQYTLMVSPATSLEITAHLDDTATLAPAGLPLGGEWECELTNGAVVEGTWSGTASSTQTVTEAQLGVGGTCTVTADAPRSIPGATWGLPPSKTVTLVPAAAASVDMGFTLTKAEKTSVSEPPAPETGKGSGSAVPNTSGSALASTGMDAAAIGWTAAGAFALGIIGLMLQRRRRASRP